jgi:hypothetical protein
MVASGSTTHYSIGHEEEEMGHDIHFLERLERLSMPQADFALALYRDPVLVRFVLANVKLPDGAERVALAVEKGPDTPYIIVARDGGFVTCLGKDMKAGDHVVVPRERLDQLSAERDDIRNAVEQVRQTGGARQIFRRLYRGGRSLTREDFVLLRFLYPLHWPALLEHTFDLADRLQAFRAGYTRGRYHRKNAVALAGLTEYWESCWALGHLIALFGTILRELLDQGPPAMIAEIRKGGDIAWLTMRTLSTPMAVRGAWTVSRAGHYLLPVYKDMFEEEPGTFLTFMNSATALTAIGLRHRKLRAEVRKTLARRRGSLYAPDSIHPHGALVRALLPVFEKVLDQEDEARDAHRQVGAAYVTKAPEGHPPDHPLHGMRSEDVPDELAYPLPLLRDTRLFGDPTAQILMPFTLPWVVSVDIEALYLPAELHAHLKAPCDPDVVLAQLDDYTRFTFRAGPVRRTATPGRNEPCSCGSGKKYKRCCGAGEAAP